MEIEPANAIFGIIALIICALPFIMMKINENKRQKKFKHSLTELAEQHNCKLGNHEVFGNFAIGMDDTNQSIIYCRQSKDKMKLQFIACKEIQSCKINKIKKIENETEVIDRIELNLIPINKTKPQIKLVFFKSKATSLLYDELRSVEKWSKLINDCMKQ